MLAAKTGRPEVVQHVLKVKKEVHTRDRKGRNALHYASMGGSLEVVKLLIDAELKLNTMDGQRKTAIHYAIFHNHQEIFDFFLDHGMRIDHQAMGAVNLGMVAASVGNLRALKILVEKGISLNSVDHTNKNTFDYAKYGKNPEVIQYLEEIKQKKSLKKA